MIKVLVVDDELPIREWIVFCLQKLPVACEIVGAVQNGRDALVLFRRHLPDLVIADIKMPVMDGLELLHEIRSMGSNARVAFLTSHSDFEYARKALHLGAHSYILKTEIQIADLEMLFDGLKESMSNSGIAVQIRKEAFVQSLLSGKFKTSKQVADELHLIGASLSNSPLAIAAVRLAGAETCFDDLELVQADCWGNVRCFSVDSTTLLVIAELIAEPSALIQLEVQSRFGRALQKISGSLVCIGGICNGLDDLQRSAILCLQGLSMNFYLQQSQKCIFAEQLQVQEETELRGHYDAVINAGVSTDGLDSILSSLRERPCLDIGLVKSCLARLAAERAAQTVTNPASLVEITRALGIQAQQCNHFDELSKVITGIDDRIALQSERQIYSTHIRLALCYIQENYAKAPTLSETSVHIGLSSEYFSRLFKQETGTSFVNYLNSYRLGKAMELLRSTPMKIYEVAELTGFSNLSYFSKQFRRQYGISPFEAKKGKLPPLD